MAWKLFHCKHSVDKIKGLCIVNLQKNMSRFKANMLLNLQGYKHLFIFRTINDAAKQSK